MAVYSVTRLNVKQVCETALKLASRDNQRRSVSGLCTCVMRHVRCTRNNAINHTHLLPVSYSSVMWLCAFASSFALRIGRAADLYTAVLRTESAADPFVN